MAAKHKSNLWMGVGTPFGRRQRISSRPPTGTTSGVDGFGSNDASVRLFRPVTWRQALYLLWTYTVKWRVSVINDVETPWDAMLLHHTVNWLQLHVVLYTAMLLYRTTRTIAFNTGFIRVFYCVPGTGQAVSSLHYSLDGVLSPTGWRHNNAIYKICKPERFTPNETFTTALTFKLFNVLNDTSEA